MTSSESNMCLTSTEMSTSSEVSDRVHPSFNFKVICIHQDGTFNLQTIPFEIGIVSLEPCTSVFDCNVCHISSNGVGSRSFHANGDVSYVLYNHDPHQEGDQCQAPINKYGDLLLSCGCGCGMEEIRDHYQGNMYVIKYDIKKGKEYSQIKHGFSHEEIIKFNYTIDCDESDVEQIKTYISQLAIQRENHEKTKWRWGWNWCTII
jgi:hypothetical protein